MNVYFGSATITSGGINAGVPGAFVKRVIFLGERLRILATPRSEHCWRRDLYGQLEIVGYEGSANLVPHHEG